MKQRRAAAPYAKALFALAKERNQTELVGREFGFSKLTSDFLALVAAHGRADHLQAIAPVLQSTWSSSPYTHNRARVSGNSSRIRCHSVQGNRQRVSLRFLLRLPVPRHGDQPHMPTEQRSWARAAARRGRRQPTMQVTAFSTPANPSWRVS